MLCISRRQGEAESSPLLQQSQQQQQQMVPLQDTYMESRAEALHNVESTIHELSNIFTQLATMVSQQGEIAIRFVNTKMCITCQNALNICEKRKYYNMLLNKLVCTTESIRTWKIHWRT